MLSIAQLLREARQKLNNISDAPALDASRLLQEVLNHDASWLYAHGEQELSADQKASFTTLVDQRATGLPLAYILGHWDFYGRTFMVTPDVLVPRPATENLVDQALTYIARQSISPLPDASLTPGVESQKTPGVFPVSGNHPQRVFTIADIGTGSGCIAITLALELPLITSYQLPVTSYKILATDISTKALAVAKQNAAAHGVANRIEFVHGNMLEPLVNKNIDLIVSNPPYVPTQELRPAPRGVRGKPETVGLRFEPRLALDGGTDGQDYLRILEKSGIPTIAEATGGKIVTYNV